MKNDFLKNVVTKTMKKPSGRIKGWKKTVNMGNIVNYKSKNDNIIVVEKVGTLWQVTDEQMFRKASLSDTKSVALRKAMDYMRQHPNG